MNYLSKLTFSLLLGLLIPVVANALSLDALEKNLTESNYDATLNAVNDYLEAHPSDKQALTLRANLLSKKNSPKAIGDYLSSLEIDNTNKDAFKQLTRLYLKLGFSTGAVSLLNVHPEYFSFDEKSDILKAHAFLIYKGATSPIPSEVKKEVNKAISLIDTLLQENTERSFNVKLLGDKIVYLNSISEFLEADNLIVKTKELQNLDDLPTFVLKAMAQTKIELKDYQSALNIASVLTSKTETDDLDAKEIKLIVLTDIQQYSAAEKELTNLNVYAADKNDNFKLRVAKLSAKIYMYAGKFDLAGNVLDKYLEIYPLDRDLNLEKVTYYNWTDHPQKAIALIEWLRSVYPDTYKESNEEIARVKLSQNLVTAAEPHLDNKDLAKQYKIATAPSILLETTREKDPYSKVSETTNRAELSMYAGSDTFISGSVAKSELKNGEQSSPKKDYSLVGTHYVTPGLSFKGGIGSFNSKAKYLVGVTANPVDELSIGLTYTKNDEKAPIKATLNGTQIATTNLSAQLKLNPQLELNSSISSSRFSDTNARTEGSMAFKWTSQPINSFSFSVTPSIYVMENKENDSNPSYFNPSKLKVGELAIGFTHRQNFKSGYLLNTLTLLDGVSFQEGYSHSGMYGLEYALSYNPLEEGLSYELSASSVRKPFDGKKETIQKLQGSAKYRF